MTCIVDQVLPQPHLTDRPICRTDFRSIITKLDFEGYVGIKEIWFE